jgi:hypothetical protein
LWGIYTTPRMKRKGVHDNLLSAGYLSKKFDKSYALGRGSYAVSLYRGASPLFVSALSGAYTVMTWTERYASVGHERVIGEGNRPRRRYA